MLQLKDITKSYTTGEFKQVALNNVSINFRKSEFVAILGPSGSGKTTLLNIIGGLDRYDNGDLIVNGKSTKNFKDSEWDAYRNNSIGFVFQSYNLIPHLNILDNVEMGMTLSGVSSSIRHEKAFEVLEKVGLKDHIHKKPNQLSGGQMQRVAIARALANDPDIILADEPTGALDTTTSIQIMDLIKEISHDKLVIMVTHNPSLAEKYADRIIRIEDGIIVDDTNPYQDIKEESSYKLKRTSMSFFTALKLSGKNILTKKFRTTLTAFASSIGIIGIALILSLSSGFQIKIDEFQRDALSEFPIIISQTAAQMDKETMEKMRGEMKSLHESKDEYPKEEKVYLYDPEEFSVVHTNKFSDEYMDHINNISPEICSRIGYLRMVGMNLLRQTDEGTVPVSISTGFSGSSQAAPTNITSTSGLGMTTYPDNIDNSEESYLEENYDLLAGGYPSDETDLVLVVDRKNRINLNILKNLGFDTENVEDIDFDEIIGTKFKLIPNDEYYTKTNFGTFIPRNDYEDMYDSEDAITLRISGIVRLKKGIDIDLLGNGIVYSDKLLQRVIDIEKDSEIVKAQKESNFNVLTMEELDDEGKKNLLSYLGADSIPYMIFLYPSDFDSKELVKEYLDEYNSGKAEEDTIVYTDLASTITEMTGSIMNAITLVLIAFSSISLIVSLIMIGIITYISVLERTKEIGVLRALGARKKDITRVFNAETFIIGTFSGLLGIGIAYALTFPVNRIIENLTELENVAQLNPLHAIMLIVISVILTLIGGAIPAKMAANKDPVVALRSE
ncbi:MAG: ABC transporter ATP-binding protein/permease [Tissierellia bacterium]|nr:ABC transporter ATP-binding protein/permease [Tissierellia bacterium]